MENLKLIVAFTCGVAVMGCFEYPALNTALASLQDKNAAIERLENMIHRN